MQINAEYPMSNVPYDIRHKQDNGIGFNGILAAKATENAAKAEWSFKNMWQTRFPGAYYHTMDASNIPMGTWCRNDYPFEKFFQNDVDESILNWKPDGSDPAMDSSGVQARLQSIRGQKAIVVPAALEEKMRNNPTLAQRIMDKIENYIVTDEAKTPNRICSYLIVLDENGEIARCRASSGGGELSGPSKAEMRQFEAEQAAKRKRRIKYMQSILRGGSGMNTKTMEGLVGAKTNMEMVNTPFRVYKQARLNDDTETMERAMGYMNDFSGKAESYKVKADEGMKEEAKEAMEKAELERKKAIEKRREERENLEKKLEENRAKNAESKADSVEISEDGKALQKEAVTEETVDAEVQSQKPAAHEPVTYVKIDANIVETASMKEMKGASINCSV